VINPHVFPKFYWTNVLPAKQIAKTYQLCPFKEVAILSGFSASVLFFTASIGVATIALLGTNVDVAIAQMPETSRGKQLGVQTISQVNVLFVNPSIGDDRAGNGGERAPLKTITQALLLATSNTQIILSKGVYSTQTGEQFPLILKPGVLIQGDSSNKGRDIVIQGGGDYLTRTFGGKNVTIVGANQAKLTGVTVINPSSRGYGLWIEYSSPIIVDNTFTGSTQDGVAVAGSGAPTISNNVFSQNGANGITISGDSQPEVRDNVFQQTGFAINITQNSQPAVVGNSITANRSGILVQANARPVVRNNLIQDNKEDGLVVLSQGMPDLGNASQPGGNVFRNNARYDINASAALQVIPAFGNTLNTNRLAGEVDLNAPSSAATTNQKLATSSTPNTTGVPISSRSTADKLLPSASIISTRQVNPTVRTQTPPPQTENRPQLNYTRISPDTIEFVAPQSTTNLPTSAPIQKANNTRHSLPQLEPAPVGPSALLPVPNTTIPTGRSSNMPRVSLSQSSTNTTASVGEPQIDLRYRVLVEVQNERDQELVKFLVPNAFRTVWRGQGVMQVGVFSSRHNAENVVNILKNNSLRAVIEPIN
jgi:parallel beta-helix repeat protein